MEYLQNLGSSEGIFIFFIYENQFKKIIKSKSIQCLLKATTEIEK